MLTCQCWILLPPSAPLLPWSAIAGLGWVSPLHRYCPATIPPRLLAARCYIILILLCISRTLTHLELAHWNSFDFGLEFRFLAATRNRRQRLLCVWPLHPHSLWWSINTLSWKSPEYALNTTKHATRRKTQSHCIRMQRTWCNFHFTCVHQLHMAYGIRI